ncbi:MAG: hypothetical protein IKZ51_08790 [Bacteroidales bacterium]|nr:hypothetical protein [Bacteroidales bacterium]
MKKLLFALLVLALSACSKELSITVEPRQPIHVTVGAGIGDAAPLTRSQVTKDGITRTLKFTAGDRLYVVGDIDETYRMGGYLDLVSGAGTASAMFSGDFTVWKKKVVTIQGQTVVTYSVAKDYDIQNTDDPMKEYGTNEVTATLVPRDAISDAIGIGMDQLCNFNYTQCLVTGQSDNASKLMETGIYVRGTYDATTASFPLACEDPVFNCNFTINGLTANTTYYVRVVKDSESTTYKPQQVTSDADGYVHFACTTESGSSDWSIQLLTSLYGNPTIHERPIGNKTLGAKVYNVGDYDYTASALSGVTSASVGSIVGSDGNIYSPDTTMPDGVSKAAMICYVSRTGHGLAIELTSNPTEIFRPPYPYPAAITGGSWHTPSLDEWQKMVEGCGGSFDFPVKYNATGVTFKSQFINEHLISGPCNYWTSDVEGPGSNPSRKYIYFSKEYTFRDGSVSMNTPLTGYFHLACFGF